MNDLISREAAIEAIMSAVFSINFVYGRSERGMAAAKEAVRVLKDLPSADVPRWIPVSERLPNGQTEVIVSCLDDSGDTPFDYTGCGWCTNDGEYWIVDNEINNYVIAWMPLPEPYQEESE